MQFLSHDIPLFDGIISDLFPGVQLPKSDYIHLANAIKNNLVKANLQSVPWFINKIIQVKNVLFYLCNWLHDDFDHCAKRCATYLDLCVPKAVCNLPRPVCTQSGVQLT